MLVVKRDGTEETLNFEKIHRVLNWAAKGLEDISISQVELHSRLLFFDGISTDTIHQTLINSAADLISEEHSDYQYMAARLAVFHLRKKVYGQFEPPTLLSHVEKMIDLDKYDPSLLELYNNEEISRMDSFVNHQRWILLMLV